MLGSWISVFASSSGSGTFEKRNAEISASDIGGIVSIAGNSLTFFCIDLTITSNEFTNESASETFVVAEGVKAGRIFCELL